MCDLTVVSLPDYATCLQILVEYHTPSNVIDHVIFTTQTALNIARHLKEKKLEINCEIIIAGAMLHDLGRCTSHQLDHGIIGAQLIRQKGLSEEIATIAENHIFGGISAQDAIDLELPSKDYIPSTLEEKIVTYADNISKNDSILTTPQVIKKFETYFDFSHPIIIRVKKLHEEIEKLLANK